MSDFKHTQIFDGPIAAEFVDVERKYQMAKANDEASRALLAEARSLLAMREAQLADCRRAMREVAAELYSMMRGANWFPSNLEPTINKLHAARAGKAWSDRGDNFKL